MFANPFTDAELGRRLHAVRAEMAAREIDVALLSVPENIFYLVGLDHWGYFAPHLLIVPAVGELTLVTRAMERVVVCNQVRNAAFVGHPDSETVADAASRVLAGVSAGKRIGAELWSAGLSFGLGESLGAKIGATLLDITGLVDIVRHVKSDEEQTLMRRAAVASDAGMQAAIAAIHAGALEADVAAECLSAMTRAGGTPPGFGPFIRPEARRAEEHTSWGDGAHVDGSQVFLEMAGCVARYNAPQGRVVHIGGMSDEDAEMAELANAAFAAILSGLKPGSRAGDVYSHWQSVVDAAGLPEYRRHHCGYLVGIGFPPSWTGGNSVVGLRHGSDLEIKKGMTFHAMSWFTDTGRGNYFVSNTVLVESDGAEVLTNTAMGPQVA